MDESNRPNINTGGGSHIAGNVQTGGDFVSRDKIEVTVFYGDKESITLKRSAIYPVTLAGKTVQTKWMITLGMLGLLAGLGLNIYMFLNFFMNLDYASIPLIIILFSAVTFAGGMMIHFGKFIHIWGMNFERGAQGRIYRTKIEGLCPKCKSSLKIYNVGSSENKTTKLVCSRNPVQHSWDFDFTLLPEIEG